VPGLDNLTSSADEWMDSKFNRNTWNSGWCNLWTTYIWLHLALNPHLTTKQVIQIITTELNGWSSVWSPNVIHELAHHYLNYCSQVKL